MPGLVPPPALGQAIVDHEHGGQKKLDYHERRKIRAQRVKAGFFQIKESLEEVKKSISNLSGSLTSIEEVVIESMEDKCDPCPPPRVIFCTPPCHVSCTERKTSCEPQVSPDVSEMMHINDNISQISLRSGWLL